MGIHFKNEVVAVVAVVDVKAPSVISRGYYVSGHVVPASSPTKCLDRDCVGRRRTGTRPGNVYRGVREKQGHVVYWQRVLQTVTSLRVVLLVCRGHDLLKIANIYPQQEATLSLLKLAGK